jgi:hypothetical protein
MKNAIAYRDIISDIFISVIKIIVKVYGNVQKNITFYIHSKLYKPIF